MRYFTPQLWVDFNNPRRSKAAFKTWDRMFKAYLGDLKKILPSLSPQGRRFFRHALVLHDGTLMRMEVGDRVSDAQLRVTRDIVNRRKATVRLFILSDRVNQHSYTLGTRISSALNYISPASWNCFPLERKRTSVIGVTTSLLLPKRNSSDTKFSFPQVPP
jgi:hypothetical protein